MLRGPADEASAPHDTPADHQHTWRAILQKCRAVWMQEQFLGIGLGPMIGVVIWVLPLGLDPAAHKAVAIAGFMLAYWIMEPIEHGITALLGCYLFWACNVTPFATAFSGFSSPIPWFLFGTLLLGEVASRTGLAKRIGYLVMQKVGTSYARLVLGLMTLLFLLNFLIPSPQAQIAIVAPLLIGLTAAFTWGPRSNAATGLFVALTYTCTLFGKMILSSNNSILARGIIETQTGLHVLWSQWLLAFLPAAVLTIPAAWLTIRWLYPVEEQPLAGDRQFFHDAVKQLGPWSRDEQRALAGLLLAVALWATDLLHQLHPGIIALGVGLFFALPKVGLLDIKAIKSMNFMLVMFMAGALSMGTVLAETGALTVLTQTVVAWMAPLLTNAFQAATILYWGGFLYHLLMADNAMVVTALPVLLKVAEVEGYNPIAMGLIWCFTTGGKVFVYQAASYVLGYSYGYFEAKDLLKVGAVMALVEGLILLILVPLYWPLIGLEWRTTPATQGAMASPVAQIAPASESDTAQAPWAPIIAPRQSQGPPSSGRPKHVGHHWAVIPATSTDGPSLGPRPRCASSKPPPAYPSAGDSNPLEAPPRVDFSSQRRHLSVVPRTLARPSGVVTQGRTCQGGT